MTAPRTLDDMVYQFRHAAPLIAELERQRQWHRLILWAIAVVPVAAMALVIGVSHG